jgi:hypothetical protein
MRTGLRRISVALGVLSVPCSFAFADKKPLPVVPLAWKPTTKIAELGAVNLTGITGVKLQVSPLTDARPDPQIVAENREDESKGKVYSVKTSSNVAEFATAHLGAVLKEAGLEVVKEGGDVTLGGEVTQFLVTEKDTYVGDVRLKLKLTGKDGKELWTGIGGGAGKRWGRSYKLENYHEVLSDSLLEAAVSLMKDEGFRKGLGAK